MDKTQSTISSTPKFLSAPMVAEMLGVSTTSAYRIIKRLNDELKSKGLIVISGKISAKYFQEKVYM